jgi:trigger factor
MKVTQEKLPASQIGLEIEIPAETTKKAYESTIQKFMRQANIPGFRKGKVPRQVIVQRFGSMGIKATSLEDLVDQSIKDAIKQENIAAIGNFQLKSDFEELVANYEPGNALVFKAAVDVQPEVKLAQHKGLTVQAEDVKLDPARIEESIDGYRKRLATLVPIEDRAAIMGDVVVVDYHGVYTPDGGEETDVPGGQAEDFTLDLEEGGFIPGFIDGIIGMNIDETKDVIATFPEDYQEEGLAGQTATFKMTLKELKGRELPEVNDEFASELTNGDVATIGITEFAAGELGDIVYVEVETIGEILDSGAVFGTVEAVKTVSDLFMPLNGEILELNTELEANPELVNESPYEDGWMIKIRISGDLPDDLLSAEEYGELVGN